MDPIEQALAILETGDSFQAADVIERDGTAEEVAARYAKASQQLYARRDVARMILLGRMGIDYCLRKAKRVASEDAGESERLLGTAKTMAYNLSVNAWPGWNEPGIELDRSDSRAALDAARLNLRLAGELKRNAEVHGNAHWLVGAQHLALEQHEAAAEQFAKAAEQFKVANKPDYEQMPLGYAAIVNMQHDATRAQGEAELASAQAALAKLGTEDAGFFITQLRAAAAFFSP
ncbi:MAG: hypothetical protein KY475_04050 [Planctomycetes bacterium]|nr:hypothetical protein [Planctomycetota bacterium]